MTGIDISQTAIVKASNQFPEIRFIVGDLLKDNPFTSNFTSNEPSTMSYEPFKKQFDLVVVKEVLWYVCHNLTRFMQNVMQLVKAKGFLYVSQSFPEADTWVGKEVIDSPERLKEILSEYTQLVHYCIEYDWNFNGRPLVHFLGRH